MKTIKKTKDIEEILLAIALLTGVVTALFKVSDYSNNNNIIFFESRIFNVFYISVASLLVELILIFVFLVLKGISIYKTESEEEKSEEITWKLFEFIFVFAYIWLLLSVIIITYQNIIISILVGIIISSIFVVIVSHFNLIEDGFKKTILKIFRYLFL